MRKLEIIRNTLEQQEETAAQKLASAIEKANAEFSHAVTLTFARKQLDRVQAEKVFGVFMKYLNERCYRRKYTRGLEQLKVAAMIDGAKSNKRLHYHISLVKPEHISDDEFKKRIKKSWSKANRSIYAVVDIQEYYSRGWLEYSAKELSENDTDAISEHCYW